MMKLIGVRSMIAACFAARIRNRCGIVALVVGTILNLINQGDVLFGVASPNWPKLLLTYLVPYFVCVYGAMSAGKHNDSR